MIPVSTPHLSEERFRELLNHPLVIEAYRTKYRPDDPYSVDATRLKSPQDVLAEQAMVTVALYGEVYDASMEGMPHPRFLAWLVDQAVPYLWMDDMRKASQVFSDIPDHIPGSRSMPFPVMFWTFPTALRQPTEGGYEADGIDCSLVFDTHGGHAQMLSFGWKEHADSSRTFRIYSGGFIKYGVSSRESTPELMAMLAFLNSPYVEAHRARLPRGERRRMEKAGYQEPEAPRFITLRQPEYEPRDKERASAGSGEWHHRWMVRGHLRAQWYPSDETHKLIWIAPYVKGPADMPMKAPVFKVIR